LPAESTDETSTTLLSSTNGSTYLSTETADGNRLDIWFIDVGQGDSIYIELPNGENMLIDGGPGSAASDLVNFLSSKNVSEIDYVFATHPHEDHIGGLDDVMTAVSVGKIYMPDATADTVAFERLLDAIDAQGLKITVPTAGNYIIGDESSLLSVRCLAPVGSSYSGLNNYSIVLKICFGNFSVILTGDAEDESEAEMIFRGYNLDADVLKLGHHGSSSSSSAAFFDAVTPEVAVISVGADNSYGHPHSDTIQSCASRGIEIYRTDELGTIFISSDGVSYSVNGDIQP